jgi:hypothetical protein
MVSACMWLRYLNRSMTACQEYTSWTFRLTPPWSPTRNLVHWCLLEGYYNYYQAPAASSRFDSGPPNLWKFVDEWLDSTRIHGREEHGRCPGTSWSTRSRRWSSKRHLMRSFWATRPRALLGGTRGTRGTGHQGIGQVPSKTIQNWDLTTEQWNLLPPNP